MSARKDVDWAVLTKRPQLMRDSLFGHIGQWYLGGGDYFPNVWMGVTAENQEWADARIPVLLDAWAGKTFVSVEPMLEPVNLAQYLVGNSRSYQHLSWVIAGGESGPHRREFRVSWAEDLWRQCQDAGVPFFGKQDSGLYPGAPLLIEGKEVKEWPR
jgi:protein gp37